MEVDVDTWGANLLVDLELYQECRLLYCVGMVPDHESCSHPGRQA